MNNTFWTIIDIIILIFLYWFVLKKRWQQQKKQRFLVYTLFYMYVCCVMFFTLMPISYHLLTISNVQHRQLNTIPFIDVMYGHYGFLKELLLNVIMTVPFGFFLPLIDRKYKFWRVLSATFLFSSSIEILQWLTSNTRIADVTDLITNTLGGIVGYLLFCCIIKIVKHH